MTKTQEEISAVCNDIKELLLYKNKQYGDSALNPSRIFSKASAVEQLLVRIDDKLNRTNYFFILCFNCIYEFTNGKFI